MDIEPTWDFSNQPLPQIQKNAQGLKMTVPSIYWVTFNFEGEVGEASKKQMVDTVVKTLLGNTP